MRNIFDRELENLNLELIRMGGMIENSIDKAITALKMQDIEQAQYVIDADKAIDEECRNIESKCLKLLLHQQPMAGDLRLISTALKMITDMERIGDQASDICVICISLAGQIYIKKLEHIPLMAEKASRMVKLSIDAFVKKDVKLAETVIEMDNEVDELFNILKQDLVELIIEDKGNVDQAIDLIMIAKYLEKIGDHAENIADWVVFSVTGEHKHKKLF